MADILTTDKLLLFLLFIVPGFISIKIYSLLVPSDRRKWSESLIEAISYSCINFAVLFWPALTINKGEFAQNHPVWYYILTIFILFVFPAVWPVAGKSVLSSKFLKGKVLHPTPKAWDYFFALGKPCWVLIHLKDGELIGGLYSKDSFSSSYPNGEDIYLEEVWKVDEKGAFVERVSQTSGMWIDKNYFDYLEFFALAKEEGDTNGE